MCLLSTNFTTYFFSAITERNMTATKQLKKSNITAAKEDKVRCFGFVTLSIAPENIKVKSAALSAT